MNFKPLSETKESIAKKIVDAAYTVHKKLRPVLLGVFVPWWLNSYLLYS